MKNQCNQHFNKNLELERLIDEMELKVFNGEAKIVLLQE